MYNIHSGVSVIICCYNSASRLTETLKHLFAQEVEPHIQWEIIVVDNASKDNTTEVAWQLYHQSCTKVSFEVISELMPGLTYAREAGLNKSNYEYLLYVDDDNWLCSDFISTVFYVMEANPKIGMLGGLGEAVFETPKPEWFDEFSACYALGPQAKSSGEVAANGFIYGASSTIRKSTWLLLREKGFNSINTGRQGENLSSGEDVELGDTLRLAGYKLWYDDRLRFKHYLPKERLTWDYIMRLAKGTGSSSLSAAIYYFVFRNKNLTKGKFQYLYYKRLVWLLSEIVKQPKHLYYYLFHKHNSKYRSSFYIARNLAVFSCSVRDRALAEKAFDAIMALKQNLKKEIAR